jgi:VWFA-related protein
MSKKFFVFWAVLIWLVAGFSPSNAQEQKPETLKIDTALVSVPVIVSDRQGRYIGGLKASDFTLYEDRVKQPIDFFADTEEPINVALLLDTSRSAVMALDDIKKAAKDFVKQLRPQDRAMIVSFDFNETVLCELTSDRKTLEKAIGKARIGEMIGTKLRDAVYDVMREEFRTVKGRKAIVLLTDGKDHGSEISERVLLDSAAEADTLIYSVFYQSLPPGFAGRGVGREDVWRGRGGRRGGIVTPRFPAPPQRRGRIEARNADAIEFLQQLSSVSAGRYFDSEVAKLKETFGQIVEELRHQYRLGFYPADHAPGSIHSLKVEIARPDVVVRSRRSYRVAGKP